MSTSTQSFKRAWLLRTEEELQLGQFDIEITGQNLPSLAEGDALLLVTAMDLRLHAYLFARIYRVSTTLHSTTVYLEAAIRPDNPTDITNDFADGPKNGKIQISLIEFSKFNTVMQRAVGFPFERLTTLSGDSVHQQAYIRRLLQIAVKGDLLGPALGQEEEIVGMSVRDRYLVGKLAPRKGGYAFECIEGLQGQVADQDSQNDESKQLAPLEEISQGKEKSARRRLPGEEFNTASGTVHDLDDDDTATVDASKNQSFVPSSVGITFCLDESVDTIELEVRWGRYERIASEVNLKEDGTPKRVWRRIPSGGVVSLPLVKGLIGPTAPDSNCPQVVVQGTVRKPLGSGERLISIFLVNNQPEVDTKQDERWLFQPELIVRDSNGRSVFRRRPHLTSDGRDLERESLEMIYRDEVEFAVGHGISVHAERDPEQPDQAKSIRSVVLPEYEVPVTETPGLDSDDRPAMRRLADEGLLDMRTLASLQQNDLVDTLRILVDDYGLWIQEQRSRIGSTVTAYDTIAHQALDRCEEIHERLLDGVKSLEGQTPESLRALEAFRFTNLAMADQRIRSIFALKRRRKEQVKISDFDVPKNRSWRPFQLAFILLSIPALADPLHKDRTKPIDAFADLLWFPTGGGKTEAYLGVAAFTMAIRRLQKDIGGYDSSRGLSVIMRYTLRLLTLQQFQRATTLICAMEEIRRGDPDTWGKEPFSLGLWVGQKVTPNTTEASHEAILNARTPRKGGAKSSPAQLTSCPWCGNEISAGRNIEVRRTRNDVGRTIIYCGDNLGQCQFSKAKSPEIGIPVVVVDEEIYRRPPSMLISTVDKFAMMAWCGQVKTLFGRAASECPRHGLLWDEAECTGRHNRQGALPSTEPKSIRPIRPPDLIIQDEFHLISGPLGTMVGLYESVIDELATWSIDERSIRPKVIASTATVRKATEQVNNVFLRRVAVFPPHGLDVGDNFFSVQRPVSEKPGRLYMGICAPGSARPAVLIRVYTALLTAGQQLFEKFGPAADPWMTVVGYFNSLRELGGMKRLAEDDVQTRCFRVNMGEVIRPGLAQRSVRVVDELTSRVSSGQIPIKLDQLEISFQATQDATTGLNSVQWKKDQTRAVDIILATNMLSVGVDVNRLGLMVVNGQPKSVSEYIQATSRVGRSFPGLVCTVMTWSRPRDLSHYETFEHFHATFYKHVEAQSVTPFAPRALDRGLTGAIVSYLRLGLDKYTPNLGAESMNDPNLPEIDRVKELFTSRAWLVTSKTEARDISYTMVGERFDEWIRQSTRGGRRLGYQSGRARAAGQDDIAGLLRKPGRETWDILTVPMSMREVEPDVRLVMSTDTWSTGPMWQPNRNLSKTGGH